MRPLISVIVPVYNVREHLADAVASIREQTFADFECILVDDGSTDGSGALCDELARADARFRVRHKANGGLSDARNAGLEAAGGELISFVDADDRLTPRALETLHAKLNAERLDVSVGCVTLHDVQTGVERPFAPLSTPCPGNVLDELFNVSACNKLYRRAVFAARRYERGILFEDAPVWADILFSGARIGYVDEPVYVYNVNRPGSIVTRRDYRGYPAQWTAQREALKAHGLYTPATASDFICRIALKFVQAYNLSSPATRDEFYRLSQGFFRQSGPFGLGRERGKAVSLAALLQARACRALPGFAYALAFYPLRLIAQPRLNDLLRRTFQK